MGRLAKEEQVVLYALSKLIHHGRHVEKGEEFVTTPEHADECVDAGIASTEAPEAPEPEVEAEAETSDDAAAE